MKNKTGTDIILHHKGALDYDKIGDLISTLKRKMKQRGVQVGLYKKLLTLMIESLENIVRYSSSLPLLQKELVINHHELLITCHNNIYSFQVSNLIQNEDISSLEDRMTRLNNLNQKKLKKLYKETITDGKFSDKGGAGLGIIEMAKISDDKLNYSFTPVKDDLFEFKLIIKINPVLADTSDA